MSQYVKVIVNLYFREMCQKYVCFKQLYLKFTCLLCVYTIVFISTSNCIRCGKYGFVCITDKYFKPCRESARNIRRNIIYKCPEDTHCNEFCAKACDSEDQRETNEYDTNQFNRAKLSYQEHRTATDLITTKIGNTPIERPMNMSSSTAKLAQQCISIRSSAHKRVKRRYYCPTEGAFLDKDNLRCFYVCYRNERSQHSPLRALALCCPPGLIFDPIKRKCNNPAKKQIFIVNKRKIVNKYPFKRKI